MRQDHQLLALKLLFTEEQVALLEYNRECIFSAVQLTRIGITQVNNEGKPHFIHRTFAEYDIALDRGKKNTSQQVQTFILKDIFLEAEYRVIRVFIGGLLLKSKQSERVLVEYGYRIQHFWKDSKL